MGQLPKIKIDVVHYGSLSIFPKMGVNYMR